MRRVALVDYGKLELHDNCESISQLKPGTVKIEVNACAICGSDVSLFRGQRDLKTELYFGHEFSGVVVDAGDGANGIKKGMRVASELSRACGHCWNCRHGLPNLCKSMNEALLPGGFSEETLMMNTPEFSWISPIPDELDDITAALLEPTNCSFRVVQQANIKPGDSVVIIGMGPMGLIADRILRQIGAGTVVGVNRNSDKLKIVRNLGFMEIIDNAHDGWQDEVREIVGERGADVVLELTGNVNILQQALDLVRPGGRIVVGSVYHGFADKVDLLPVMRKELTIVGGKGPYPQQKSNGESVTVEMLTKLKDDLRKIVTVYDYKHAIQAFEDQMAGRSIKSVVVFDK